MFVSKSKSIQTFPFFLSISVLRTFIIIDSNSSIFSLYFWAKCLSNTWLPHNSGQHRVRLRSCSFRKVRDWICAWKLKNMDFSKNCNIHIFTIVVFTLLKILHSSHKLYWQNYIRLPIVPISLTCLLLHRTELKI